MAFALISDTQAIQATDAQDIQTIDSPNYILDKLPDGFEYCFEPFVFRGDIKFKISIRKTPVWKRWGRELIGGGSLVGFAGVVLLALKFWSTIKELEKRKAA